MLPDIEYIFFYFFDNSIVYNQKIKEACNAIDKKMQYFVATYFTPGKIVLF